MKPQSMKPGDQMRVVQAALGQPFPEAESEKRGAGEKPPPRPASWETPIGMWWRLYSAPGAAPEIEQSASARRVLAAMTARDEQLAAHLARILYESRRRGGASLAQRIAALVAHLGHRKASAAQ